MDSSPSQQVGYVAAADLLRTKILRGEYPPGSQLPSEKDLCHVVGCGLDAVRDALGVLRRELLITTRRGYRSLVCAPPDRATVSLAPGDRVTAWMPMRPESAKLGGRPEMPVLIVAGADGTTVCHLADQVELIAPPAAAAGDAS
ncbi:winged helix-turn-helix domain-containing protein [Dactylosporangium sp. NPDC048998]|uniref:winged helix-turn-helix domain-containing protein n=1 Tax=Dactylosporangium sp. NPDC048998 TaxID=3363976 RepID=UPI003716F6B3